jgi:hypothetical protein
MKINIRKNILRNFNVLNLVLLATALSIFFQLNDSLAYKPVRFTLSNPGSVLMGDKENATPEKAANNQDYAIIMEKNLFHPERKIPVEKKQEQQVARPEIILYGTLITDEQGIAYIEDIKNPYSTPGRGKRQVTVKEGDTISGYKLIKISVGSILLARGDDKMTVFLNTRKERKSAEFTVADATLDPNRNNIPQQTVATQPFVSPAAPYQDQIKFQHPIQMPIMKQRLRLHDNNDLQAK